MNAQRISLVACRGCEHSVPANAHFCPYCGELDPHPIPAAPSYVGENAETRIFQAVEVEARHPVRNTDILLDAVDDVSFRRTPARLGLMALVALAALGAVLAIVGSPFESADPSAQDAEAVATPRAVDEGQKPEVAAAREFTIHTAADSGEDFVEIRLGDEVAHTVLTERASRYDDPEARARAVTVRLNHVAQKFRESHASGGKTPQFAARANGDRYEVVWRDGSEDSFRILDVTAADVEAWNASKESKTSTHILANLIADNLNDLFERAVVARPNA